MTGMDRERHILSYRDELISWGIASAVGGLLGFLAAGAVLNRAVGEGLRLSALGVGLGLAAGALVGIPLTRYRLIPHARTAAAGERPRATTPARTLVRVAVVALLLVGLLALLDDGAEALASPMVLVAGGVQNLCLGLWLY